jgi:hypothetical protein
LNEKDEAGPSSGLESWMNGKTIFAEKRKWPRYRVGAGAFVEFTKPRFFNLRKPGNGKLAPILDISTGGLAFQYESPAMWAIGSHRMSISIPDDQMIIEYVPFKVISDHKRYKIDRSREFRRCGVAFDRLTADHKIQIDRLMRNYRTSTKTPPDKPTRRSTRSGWQYVDLTTKK